MSASLNRNPFVKVAVLNVGKLLTKRKVGQIFFAAEKNLCFFLLGLHQFGYASSRSSKVFKKFDANGDGNVSVAELQHVLEAVAKGGMPGMLGMCDARA